jgi:hypothetical protein
VKLAEVLRNNEREHLKDKESEKETNSRNQNIRDLRRNAKLG